MPALKSKRPASAAKVKKAPATAARIAVPHERERLQAAFLMQAELRESRDYIEAVLETVPPLLVLDAKLRVVTANESFCKCFKIPLKKVLKRLVYELGNGEWNIPQLRTFLEDVLPQKFYFKDFEVTHKFESIGKRTMLLSGHQVDHIQRILLSIDDITERRKEQAAVRASEIRYRRLFEAARDGILILDPETRKITDANPFMTELLGYPRKQLIGKELWQIGLLKDEAASQEAFRELRKTHFIRYEDLPLQNKDGKRHEVEFVSNLYDEDGRSVIQCNIRDITDRKMTEAALRKSEARYRDLFDSMDEGFCVIEMIYDQHKKPVDYWFLEVNPSFATQSGLADAPGKRVRDLIPDFEEHWIEAFGKVARTGLPVRLENQAKGLGNGWFEVHAFPLSGPDSGKVAILFKNITARKQAEEELMAVRARLDQHALELERVVDERTVELRETIGELERFSYSISHDMRAPLRAMQSYSSYLIDEYGDKLNEQGVEYLQKIMRSSVRLDHLIKDVLSYARVLHNRTPLVKVDLDRLVRDLVEGMPNGQPIAPRIEIMGTFPSVMGNEALLGQCVSNLLNNAVKFVAPGTAPRVDISSATMNGSVRLSFKDNGIGIARQNHDRIFGLLERIHPDSQYEGTGIGLTIVRKATERMDGQVGFESELGKGSNFWIEIKQA
jgi:PAS domain S-box-containing protein